MHAGRDAGEGPPPGLGNGAAAFFADPVTPLAHPLERVGQLLGPSGQSLVAQRIEIPRRDDLSVREHIADQPRTFGVRLDQGDAFMPLDARENEIELPA